MTYIAREALLKEANQEGAYGYVDIWQIAQMPAADVVKVIKCEDCKLYEPSTTGVSWQGWCKRFRNHMDANDYCSRGKQEG